MRSMQGRLNIEGFGYRFRAFAKHPDGIHHHYLNVERYAVRDSSAVIQTSKVPEMPCD